MFPVLKQMLGRRGGDLSGGQQQQLAIARALVMRPKLLILDEPTEGIQPSIIKEIERVIHALSERGDMAILLVEQYFDFARELADQYLVLRRGEIVKRGSGAEMDAAGAAQLPGGLATPAQARGAMPESVHQPWESHWGGAILLPPQALPSRCSLLKK